MKHFIRCCSAFLFLTAFAFSQAHAAPSIEVAKGLAWLQSQVQGDGTLSNDANSIATPLQSHTEALQSFKLLSVIPTPLADGVAAEVEDSTEYLARKIIALSLAGRDVSVLAGQLASRQGEDGGFGGAAGYDGNPLDTAFALLALNGRVSTASIPKALGYLQTIQNADGSYQFGELEKLYTTAYVLQALRAFEGQYPLNTTSQKAVIFLQSQPLQSGLWGGSLSLSASVYLGLHDYIPLEPTAGTLAGILIGLQAPDGSWEAGDPFTTALVLRALSASSIAPQDPTKARISGRVIDGLTKQALAGVTISLSGGPSMATLQDGLFALEGLAPGAYTLSLAHPNYAPLSTNLLLLAGQALNLGDLSLLAIQDGTTGIVRGTARDASTAQALAGATVSVVNTTLAATTGADGTYQISGVPVGNIELRATKTGYTTAAGSGTMVAGGQLLFSPSLVPGSASATALQGKVTDVVSGLPITGALISVSGSSITSATTDAAGQYQINSLVPGAISIVVTATGYDTVTASATVVSNTTLLFSPALRTNGLPPPPDANTVAGRVLDAATDAPLEGVTVSGASSAITGADGRFQIAKGGEITFAKTGYVGGAITFESAGAALSSASDLGDIRLLRENYTGAQLPDLLVAGIDTSTLLTDPQTLQASGSVSINISNFGTVSTAQDTVVTLVEDADASGTLSGGDLLLGTGVVPAGLAPDGAPVKVDIAIAPFQRSFRNSRLLAVIDKDQVLPEVREDNNAGVSACLKPFPFVDDFNDGIFDGWKTVFGAATATITNGVLGVSSNSGYLTGDLNWSDYTAEIRLRFPNGANNDAGLQVRHLGISDHSAYQLRFKSNHARIIYQGGSIAEAPFLVETNRWYQMRMEVTGSTLRAFIDNQLIFNIPNLQIPRGAVGIQQDGGVNVEYDDLRVYGPATAGPADISASYLRIVDMGVSGVEARVRIGNGGGEVIPAGAKVAFFKNAPESGGTLLGTYALSSNMSPGAWQDIKLAIGSSLAGMTELVVIADHDGTAPGTLAECDKLNNRISLALAPDTVSASFAFGVNTDQTIYPANSLVVITASAKNVGSLSGALKVRFDVESGDGIYHVSTLPIAGPITIASGATQAILGNWSTGIYAAGDYAAVATFLDAQDRVIGTARTLFSIVPSCGNANSPGTAVSMLAIPASIPGNDPGHLTPVLRYTLDSAGQLADLPSIPSTPLTLVNDPIYSAFNRYGELFISNRHGNISPTVGSIARFKFDAQGNPVANGAITGNGLGAVHGIAFSPTGELFAANLLSGTVSQFRFDAQGNAIPNGFFSSGGAQGVAVSKIGEVFVSSGSTINRFKIDLNTGVATPSGAINVPGGALHGLGFSQQGELFAAALGSNVVFRYVFDGNGNAIPNGTISTPGNPIGIGFSPAGELFVSLHYGGGFYRFLFDQAGNAIPNGFVTAPQLGGIALSPTMLLGPSNCGAQVISAKIATDKQSYQPYDLVKVLDRVTNLTQNQAVDGLTAVSTVTKPDGTVLWAKSALLSQLVAGAYQDLSYSVPLSNAVAGAYKASLTVLNSGGAQTAYAETFFTVDTSSNTGSGLTGTIFADPKLVPIGDAVLLSSSAVNLGNADLTNVDLKTTIVDPLAQTVVAEWPETVTLTQQLPYSVSRSWTTQGGIGQTYVAVLTAVVGGKTLTLAQDSFTLTEAPVKFDVIQSRLADSRVLVLAACSGSSSGDDDEHDDDGHDDDGRSTSCATKRAAAIEAYLAARNIKRLVTTDENVFLKVLRSGYYNVYWLSGGSAELTNDIEEELAEAVYRGDSLILDNLSGVRAAYVDRVAGTHYHGSLSPSSLNVTTTNVLFPTATRSTSGVPAYLKLTTGQVQAKFATPSYYNEKLSCSESHTSTSGTYPAIVTNQYGAGRAITYGFDMVTSLQGTAGWNTVFDSALGYLKPPILASFTGGGYVPVITMITNQAKAVDLEVILTAPPGGYIVDTLPLASVDPTGRPVWSINLSEAARADLLAGLRLPLATGTATLTTTVNSIRNGQATLYGNYNMTLTVKNANTRINEVITGLKALSISNSYDKGYRDAAVYYLNLATPLLNGSSSQLNTAVNYLVESAKYLAKITTVNVSTYRTGTDLIIQETQFKWFKLQP